MSPLIFPGNFTKLVFETCCTSGCASSSTNIYMALGDTSCHCQSSKVHLHDTDSHAGGHGTSMKDPQQGSFGVWSSFWRTLTLGASWVCLSISSQYHLMLSSSLFIIMFYHILWIQGHYKLRTWSPISTGTFLSGSSGNIWDQAGTHHCLSSSF